MDDLFLFVHNRQDDDLSKVPADSISKITNIRMSALKQTDVVKVLK